MSVSPYAAAPGPPPPRLDYAPAPPAGRRRGPAIGPGTVAVVLVTAALLAAVGFGVSLPIAGMIFAVLVVGVSFVRPDVTFLVVFLAAPLVQDIGGSGTDHGGSGISVAVADLTVVLAAPALLARFARSGRRLARNPMLLPVLAYLAVCVASSAVNGSSTSALTAIAQMALYTLLIVYVFANAVDGPAQIRPAFYGLLATNVVIAAVVVGLRSNYVLGMHKNAIGSELSYAVVIAAELWLAKAAGRRSRWVISAVLIVLAVGLVSSLSRGAWLAAIVGVLVLLLLRRQVKVAVGGLLLVAPAIALCWFLLPKASHDYALDFNRSAENIDARYRSLGQAWAVFVDRPILGIGVDYRKVTDATNLVVDTMAETGVPGLITFLAIFAAFGWMVAKARRRLSPSDPAFSLLAIGAALMAGKVAHGCVDHYWSRVMLPVWASAGLAVYAYNLSLARPGRASPVVRRGQP